MFFLVCFSFQSVQADEYRPAYLEILQTEGELFDVLWKVPARGQTQRLSLYVEFSNDVETIIPARSSYVRGAFFDRSTISHSGGLTDARISIKGLGRVSTDVLVRIQRLDGSSETTRLNAE